MMLIPFLSSLLAFIYYGKITCVIYQIVAVFTKERLDVFSGVIFAFVSRF